jgi:chemotaxis protein MotB
MLFFIKVFLILMNRKNTTMKTSHLIVPLALILIFSSCVPLRQFEELKVKNDEVATERDSLKSVNEELTVSNTERASEIEELHKRFAAKAGENQVLVDSIDELQTEYKVLQQFNEDLKANNQEILKGNAEETRMLLAKLQVAQEDLQNQEDSLMKLKKNLDIQQANLEKLNTELNTKDAKLKASAQELEAKEKELEAKIQRTNELERILYSKDSVVNALRTKVSDALLGFQNKGLTIEQKNGKVYVSLEEQLLFKFGSTDVDPNGVKALQNLAKVLEQNPDINIMIEGHTDDVGDANYNWDLSVKRATSIVKILLDNSSIDPTRLTASGRGEFMPIDAAETDEARKKNRRTEIILTPKLDELFKILE